MPPASAVVAAAERETPPSGPLLGPLFFHLLHPELLPSSSRAPPERPNPPRNHSMPKPQRRHDSHPQGRTPRAASSRGEATAPGAEGEASVDLAVATARTITAVEAVAAPVLAAHHCELVQLEYRREPHGWVLRLYVERLGHDPRLSIGGVDLADCSRISRDLSTALDVAGTIEHAYHLEISSPGLERPLGAVEHYRRFAGLPAKLVLRTAVVVGGRSQRVLQGELLGTEGEGASARVRVADTQLGPTSVPFADVARAHLVYVPKTGEKPGKSARSSQGRTGSAKHADKTARAAQVGAGAAAATDDSGTTNPRETADRQWHDGTQYDETVENER